MSRINITGENNIPNKASLFIPNRLSVEALKKLCHLLEKRVKLLIDPSFTLEEKLGEWVKKSGFEVMQVDIKAGQMRSLREELFTTLAEDKNIIFLPGEGVHHRGMLSDIPAAFLRHLGQLHISPVPVFNTHCRQSLVKLMTELPASDTKEYLSILPQLSPGPRASERMLAAWMNSSADIFEQQPILSGSLTTELVKALKAHKNNVIVDGMTDTSVPNYKILGVAMAMANKLLETPESERDKRMGIILPPGPGATIATVACLLAGITPVMINYASSHGAFASIVRQAGLKHFVTAGKFVEKLPNFAWPPKNQLILIEELIKGLGKPKLIANVLKAKIMPAGLICRKFRTDARRDQDNAVLLFTSGSSGEPKGVALTHRMLLANVAQCSSRLDFQSENVLGSLPIFHSFGLTVTMMLPLLTGHPICTFPNPTDAKRLCELIQKYKLTLVCSTPTFARAMLRRANRGDFASVRYFVVGAEKLHDDLRKEFYDLHQLELLEGYGMTEASPVCTVNMPSVPSDRNIELNNPQNIAGSIGCPLPGMALRLTDLDDDSKEIPLTERGMLWLRGANVFSGYVGKPEVHQEIFAGKWFKTGDIAEMSLDGFVRLSGRLSRFSKVGGEMVPHEGVEQLIIKALRLDPNASELQVAVTGVTDAQKGEAIVLLSTLPEHQQQSKEAENLSRIRQKLIDQRIPNLWLPKHIVPVESIPILASGKLDLRGCKQLADEALLEE